MSTASIEPCGVCEPVHLYNGGVEVHDGECIPEREARRLLCDELNDADARMLIEETINASLDLLSKCLVNLPRLNDEGQLLQDALDMLETMASGETEHTPDQLEILAALFLLVVSGRFFKQHAVEAQHSWHLVRCLDEDDDDDIIYSPSVVQLDVLRLIVVPLLTACERMSEMQQYHMFNDAAEHVADLCDGPTEVKEDFSIRISSDCRVLCLDWDDTVYLHDHIPEIFDLYEMVSSIMDPLVLQDMLRAGVPHRRFLTALVDSFLASNREVYIVSFGRDEWVLPAAAAVFGNRIPEERIYTRSAEPDGKEPADKTDWLCEIATTCNVELCEVLLVDDAFNNYKTALEQGFQSIKVSPREGLHWGVWSQELMLQALSQGQLSLCSQSLAAHKHKLAQLQGGTKPQVRDLPRDSSEHVLPRSPRKEPKPAPDTQGPEPKTPSLPDGDQSDTAEGECLVSVGAGVALEPIYEVDESDAELVEDVEELMHVVVEGIMEQGVEPVVVVTAVPGAHVDQEGPLHGCAQREWKHPDWPIPVIDAPCPPGMAAAQDSEDNEPAAASARDELTDAQAGGPVDVAQDDGEEGLPANKASSAASCGVNTNEAVADGDDVAGAADKVVVLMMQTTQAGVEVEVRGATKEAPESEAAYAVADEVEEVTAAEGGPQSPSANSGRKLHQRRQSWRNLPVYACDAGEESEAADSPAGEQMEGQGPLLFAQDDMPVPAGGDLLLACGLVPRSAVASSSNPLPQPACILPATVLSGAMCQDEDGMLPPSPAWGVVDRSRLADAEQLHEAAHQTAEQLPQVDLSLRQPSTPVQEAPPASPAESTLSDVTSTCDSIAVSVAVSEVAMGQTAAAAEVSMNLSSAFDAVAQTEEVDGTVEDVPAWASGQNVASSATDLPQKVPPSRFVHDTMAPAQMSMAIVKVSKRQHRAPRGLWKHLLKSRRPVGAPPSAAPAGQLNAKKTATAKAAKAQPSTDPVLTAPLPAAKGQMSVEGGEQWEGEKPKRLNLFSRAKRLLTRGKQRRVMDA